MENNKTDKKPLTKAKSIFSKTNLPFTSSVFLSSFILFFFFGSVLLTKPKKKTAEIYQVQTVCQGLVLNVIPNSVDKGGDMLFSASFASPLVCVYLETDTGIQEHQPLQINNIGGVYYWEWQAIAVNTDGSFTASFMGNTMDSGSGSCPDRAVGEWCEVSTEYTVGSPQASPTPLPSLEPSPAEDVPPPTGEGYIFKIKGPSHRQIIFCKDYQSDGYVCTGSEGIDIEIDNTYSFDFSNYKLEFGDVDNNGQINTQDYSFVKTCIEHNAKAGDDFYEQGCQWADGNFDSEVNSTDMDLLYNTLSGDTDDEEL